MNRPSRHLLAATLALAGAAPSAAAQTAEPPAVATAAPPAVSAPAPARSPLRFSLSVDAINEWHLDSSYAIFSRKRHVVTAGGTVTADVVRMGRSTLALGLGFHGDELSAPWAGDGGSSPFADRSGSHQAQLQTYTGTLSALLRWELHPWLQPHMRLAADGTWGRFKLSASDGTALDDESFSPGVAAGAGFRLRTHTIGTNLQGRGGNLGFALGLTVEGGFHFGTPLSFEMARSKPADDKLAADQLPGPKVAVGDFGRSQPYLRFSFALLF
jgi:hypothetical protein